MRALILAAGMGMRLGNGLPPKSLLKFAGKSLLQRHLEILVECGVAEVVVGVGYQADKIVAELAALDIGVPVRTVFNPEYDEGNIVTLSKLREELVQGGNVLVMDADVIYDERLMHRLLASAHVNCFLLDRGLDPGNEPVKVCVRDGRIVELRKQVDPDLDYDFHGESVGFFRLCERMAGHLAATVDEFLEQGRRDVLYEEALRSLVRSGAGPDFGFEDITGLPWTEIDFPEDVQRAEREILPRLADVELG